MFRFNLKTLLSIVALVATACAFAVMITRLRHSEAELSVLRSEAGSLTISDPNLIHIHNVNTNDAYSWKWRIYVPPRTRLEAGIELDGKYRSEGKPTGGASSVVPSVPNGVVLSVSVSPLVDDISTITVRVDNQTFATLSTNLNPSDWLPTPNNRTIAADVETEKIGYETPIRLLTRRVPGISTDDWHPWGGKEVGLVVWAVPHKER